MKRTISLILAIVMLLSVFAGMNVTAFATQSRSGNFWKTYTLTGNGANDIVAVAQAQNGRSQASMGYTEAWCADFVSDCARLANQEAVVPFTGGVSAMYNGILNAGGVAVSSPQRGDICFFNFGHVGIMVDSVNCISGNMNNSYVQTFAYTAINVGSTKRFLRPRYSVPAPTPSGSEMAAGYGRTIPDGSYVIANAGTTTKGELYYLDIEGTAKPAANTTNVSLCGPTKEPASYDVWDLKYSGGFYTIKQKGTNISLDVAGNSALNGTNLIAHEYHGGSNQQWAISANGRDGYRIQSKRSGYSVDVCGGGTVTGTNVQQYIGNDTAAQSWFFVPYQPAQTLANGRYILVSALADNMVLDVSGDTANVAENTNVQLWKDTALSRYNSFDIIKLSDGYYKIMHAASGKCLDVSDGVSKPGSNVAIHTDNGSLAQRWAITKDGVNGGYVLRAKCSGYALDVKGSATANGTNVEQYPFHGGKNQTWKFVKAEYKVSFNANGGSGAPAAVIKYYKNDLKINVKEPTRANYTFAGWSTTADGSSGIFKTGFSYKQDKDVTLYAQWTRNHTYNSGKVTKAATCTTAGVKLYTCTQCGQTKTETIPALGHRWSKYACEYEEIATCTQPAYRYECSRCERCGEERWQNIKSENALGHNYRDGVAKPTATAVGYKGLICTRCGDAKSKSSYTAPTGKVSGLKCKVREANAQTIRWTPVEDAKGYQIRISTADGKKWDKSYHTGTSTSYRFSSLSAAGSYLFQVRLYDTDEKGNRYYGPWSTKLVSPCLPNGTVFTGIKGASKAFTASWQKHVVSGYQLQYATNAQFSGAKTVTLSGANTLKTTVKKLSANRAYYVRVRTYKTIGGANYCSAWSRICKVSTKG